MEARKVQRVGYSTLTVSLPRDWVQDVGLKQGDLVSIRREDDGSLRIFRGLEAKQQRTGPVVIDADLCDKPNLLTRLITANYILGHDSIKIISHRDLTSEHLAEVRKTTQRLTGLGIVEQTLKQVTLQSFIDPTKFPVYGLMRRLHVVVSSMLEVAIRALSQSRADLANEVQHMEAEADRVYWLIIRQLLLAIRDRTVGAKIGIESPVHIAGNRVIAKTLEEMADNVENIALEVLTLNGKTQKGPILESITKLASAAQAVSDKTMRALMASDIKLASTTIDSVEASLKEEKRITERIITSIKDVNAAVSLRTIVLNLAQMMKYCRIIDEVTINRVCEQPTDISHFEAEEIAQSAQS